MQCALVYITSYFDKTGLQWTQTGTATWLALQLDYFRTPVGDFLLNFPELLKLLTKAVLLWEGFGPLLWFSPFFTGLIPATVHSLFRPFTNSGYHWILFYAFQFHDLFAPWPIWPDWHIRCAYIVANMVLGKCRIQ